MAGISTKPHTAQSVMDRSLDSPRIEFAALPATAERGALSLEYGWVNAHLRDAPIVVFLHEGLGSIAMWRRWPQAICDRLGMRGLLYSRPGYGRSTPRTRNEKWPVDYLARQAYDVLPALLGTLGITADERKRMWLVGHSDGGTIALYYASRFLHALAGAVVIAPHEFVEAATVEGIAKTRIAYETTDLRTRLARYHADVDSAFYGWNDIWLDPAFRAWDMLDELPRIACPLLAIQAEDDHYASMAQIDAIGSRVAHARLCRLAEGGHSPHRDAPGPLTEAIASFIPVATT